MYEIQLSLMLGILCGFILYINLFHIYYLTKTKTKNTEIEKKAKAIIYAMNSSGLLKVVELKREEFKLFQKDSFNNEKVDSTFKNIKHFKNIKR